jgi:hypothetical protein
MTIPNSGGVLRTSLVDMQIGDFILCNYQASSGSVGTFSNLGGALGTEIPVAGATAPNGSFYLVKVDKGLLVSSIVVQNSINWDSLNAGDYIQGKPVTLNGQNFIIRSLGGGNSYASATGTSQTADAGVGAWPVDNEYEKYIAQWSMIESGKTLQDVWHWGTASWTQDTPIGAINTSSYRIIRGANSANYFLPYTSATSNTVCGFRPVFEEVTP